MRTWALSAVVVVLGIATCAGVGFSDCGNQGNQGLIWINPTGAAAPASHTYIRCSESGANTPNLALSAVHLLPGDSCEFGASLANVGNQPLRITVSMTESTPHGDPTFATCFSFSLSAGPASGQIAGGGSFPYAFTVQVLSTAPAVCGTATGTVSITFSGSSPCSSGGWGQTQPRDRLGPGANLKNADLQDLDLAGYDMAGDNLQGANLQCDYLVGTNLAGANLQGANLGGSDLMGASLTGANAQSAQFVDTTLSGADLAGANLQFANLEGAWLTGYPGAVTDFNGANLVGINVAGVTATGYLTAVGATIGGTLNLASCVATSGTPLYCDEL